MTTYAPYPEVPTAAVLPVDDCVIAPPVTATSTVFRTPNCPTIRWEASRCREPSARAFAVRRTSSMDSRVVGGVGGSGFHSHARRAVCAVADDLGVVAHKGLLQARTALVHDSRINPVDWRCSACQHSKVADPEALEGIRLSRRHHPRICSEADVKHGCGVVGGVSAAVLSPARRAYPSLLSLATYSCSDPFALKGHMLFPPLTTRIGVLMPPPERCSIRVCACAFIASLARAEHPRICSEADVTHGYGVESYVARASLRRRPLSPGWKVRCMARQPTSRTRRSRSGRARSAARGCGFLSLRPGAKPAPAHLQCQRQSPYTAGTYSANPAPGTSSR